MRAAGCAGLYVPGQRGRPQLWLDHFREHPGCWCVHVALLLKGGGGDEFVHLCLVRMAGGGWSALGSLPGELVLRLPLSYQPGWLAASFRMPLARAWQHKFMKHSIAYTTHSLTCSAETRGWPSPPAS